MLVVNTPQFPLAAIQGQPKTNENQEHTKTWAYFLNHEEFKGVKEHQGIALAKMLLAITVDAFQSYQKSEYQKFDAHIGNYGCEVQAFNVLYLAHSEKLQNGYGAMAATTEKIQKMVNAQQDPEQRIPFDQWKESLLGVKISKQMQYLIQSRLLTITKEPVYDPAKFDSRQYEKLKTVTTNLRSYSESVTRTLMDHMVFIAQQKMSELSISFIGAKLEELSASFGEEGGLVRKMMRKENLHTPPIDKKSNVSKYPKTFSCGYFNTKALLLLVENLNTPLIIKKLVRSSEIPETFAAFMQKGTSGAFEEIRLDELTPGMPVMVCTAYLPDNIGRQEWSENVAKHGLKAMLLADASQEDHYVHGDGKLVVQDKVAFAEIASWAERAKDLDCDRAIGSLLHIDHFYCSAWGKE